MEEEALGLAFSIPAFPHPCLPLMTVCLLLVLFVAAAARDWDTRPYLYACLLPGAVPTAFLAFPGLLPLVPGWTDSYAGGAATPRWAGWGSAACLAACQAHWGWWGGQRLYTMLAFMPCLEQGWRRRTPCLPIPPACLPTLRLGQGGGGGQEDPYQGCLSPCHAQAGRWPAFQAASPSPPVYCIQGASLFPAHFPHPCLPLGRGGLLMRLPMAMYCGCERGPSPYLPLPYLCLPP